MHIWKHLEWILLMILILIMMIIIIILLYLVHFFSDLRFLS